MKKLLICIAASASILIAAGYYSAARAYTGMTCYGAGGCGRCEVCVKPSVTATSGTCMAVQGCH